MKNVAVCYSGQIRNFKECFPSFLENIVSQNPDCRFYYFAHFWYDQKLKGQMYDTGVENKGTWEEENLKNFLSINPEAFLIEKPLDFNFEITQDSRFSSLIEKNILSMYYSIEKSYDVFKNFCKLRKLNFEKIIRIRTDCFFKQKVNLDSFSEGIVLKNQKIHTEYGINDHFAYGNVLDMEKYFQTYSKIKDIVDKGCPVLPECILGFNLINQNIKIHYAINDEFVLYRLL